MSDMVQSICIVGGGSAGWLTAALIAARHQRADGGDLSITLVESERIGIVGVGEGTWPTMRQTLKKAGVSETDFLRACNASFKQGAKFARWRTGAADDFYYHPLMLPEGFPTLNLAAHWLARSEDEGTPSFSDAVCFQEALCERHLAPKLFTSPEYGGIANYAYHLDAVRFAEFMRVHCTEKLGVRHIVDDVGAVELAEDGQIAAVVTRGHGRLAADLFVDCSGFSALLLGETLGVPFIDRSDVLFIDRALAVQVPHEEEDAPIVSHTVSTAQRHGWIWDIGLQNRRGVGYVYSSRHAGSEPVEAELAAYVGPGFDRLTTRELKIRSGHRATFWKGNCVAVGLAAGFLEPLEASALVLIELSADVIASSLPMTKSGMRILAQRFNDMTRYRWDRIIDFLKLHYMLSERDDSAFWRDNRDPATIPQSLQDQLELWRHVPPTEADFDSAHEMFPAASYQYVLYGMGFRPDRRGWAIGRREREAAHDAFDRAAALKRRLAAEMPTNRQLLSRLAQHRFQTV
ncbi:tryptophan halogenase family protein [Sphingomonas sp. ASY06-1R]|jgi:glycine/D-amino acid oxidase-like deaminating enzyme|uniref:tryptophan halogenase family protein n=1 Tax=Sphingomonas sp. ASY06-1R TaxID=3445771 RepID=UPI003FA2B9F2